MLQLSLNNWINKLNLTLNMSLLEDISYPNKYKNNEVYDYNIHISVADTIPLKKSYTWIFTFWFIVAACFL